jgi:phosphohistidine phosphatase
MNNSKDNIHTSLPESKEGNKILLVVRHAKSSWEVNTLNDFERPLNDRGKKDAPIMAQRLIDKKIKIDAFVSSPAKRAKKTAELFCSTFGKNVNDIIFVSKLYHAFADIFFEVAEELDDVYNTVAVFSHNPGITTFVNLLSPEKNIDNMPTCGVFSIKINSAKWSDFNKAILFFDYPKLT